MSDSSRNPAPDRIAPVVGRIVVGVIAAALGAAAIMAMYLGITRAGMPVTVLRTVMTLPVPMFAVLGFYSALLIWFGPVFGLRQPLESRRAIVIGGILALTASLVFLGIVIAHEP